MNETKLVESKNLRDQVADRVEVLDKVKELVLLPQLHMMTMQQVADYYQVDFDAIKSCYRRNREEIDADGAGKIPVKSMVSRLGQNDTIVSAQGYKEFKLSDDVTLRVPNVGILLFPKRAILRIGMLLRDSEVAKEVRTQLLNVFENSTDEEKTAEIDNEMKMYENLAKAFVTGSKEDMMSTMQDIVQYHRRHIEALTSENEEVKNSNKMLAADILRWDDRKSVTKAVRVISHLSSKPIGYIWKNLYDELRYKHSIGLSQRGKAPLIQHIREDEWFAVQQSLSAICEDLGLSPAYVLKRSKLSGVGKPE